MRYFYLTVIAALLTLSGCTMHPPSASGFMEAMERTIDGPDKSGVISATAKKNNFSMSADEWEIPIGLEYVKSTNNGFVSGFGLLPSPYFVVGFGNQYLATRVWASAIWVGVTVAIVCASGYCSDDDEDGEYSYSYESDDDDIVLDSWLAAWTELFSGGFSLIQQIPIGDALRIGVEEYICRNIWLNFSDFGEQEDFGNVELGIGGYVSFRFGIHRLSLEARYAMLDFNPSKPRLTVSLSYNYSVPLKRVTAN